MKDRLLWINVILLPITFVAFWIQSQKLPPEELVIHRPPVHQPIVEPPDKFTNISETKPSFMKYSSMVELLKRWESEAEDFVEVGTYGKTSQGQDQYYIRITNESKEGGKPRSLMTGCIHGNEPISTWTTMWWIGRILSTYGEDPEVTSLVDTRELYFIPVICPDSYLNKRYSNGVDPNRDFPSSGEKSSIRPIQNLKDFFKEMKFDAYASGHSYGRVFMFASNDDKEREETYARIKDEMSNRTDYRTTYLNGPGTTLDADWGNRHGAFSVLIEFGTHQRPPSDRDIQDEFDKTYKAVLYFMKEASVAFGQSN